MYQNFIKNIGKIQILYQKSLSTLTPLAMFDNKCTSHMLQCPQSRLLNALLPQLLPLAIGPSTLFLPAAFDLLIVINFVLIETSEHLETDRPTPSVRYKAICLFPVALAPGHMYCKARNKAQQPADPIFCPRTWPIVLQ